MDIVDWDIIHHKRHRLLIVEHLTDKHAVFRRIQRHGLAKYAACFVIDVVTLQPGRSGYVINLLIRFAVDPGNTEWSVFKIALHAHTFRMKIVRSLCVVEDRFAHSAKHTAFRIDFLATLHSLYFEI